MAGANANVASSPSGFRSSGSPSASTPGSDAHAPTQPPASPADVDDAFFSKLPARPSARSRRAIQRLAALPPEIELTITTAPPKKLAAVLVLIHVDQDGELAVTLTKRAETLRTHAGQTALPGGRVDASDASVLEAAWREANEEINLPLPPPRGLAPYRYLTTLPPLVSRHHLLVLPVVALLVAPSYAELAATLRASPTEVAAIFSWPLRDFLAPSEGSAVHTWHDVPFVHGTPYRWHSLAHETMASPVTGLTFDVLANTAVEAFGEGPPTYELAAPGQMPWPQAVRWVIAQTQEPAGAP